MADLASLAALARPRHWIKNGLVLMPLPFAIADGAEVDRQHPDKCRRPVASGKVSLRAAGVFAALLLVAGMSLCWAARRPAVLTIAGSYVALNVLYSLWARAVALVDVFLLAAGYVLLGCALLGLPASNWLLLCTSMLAFFLALAKRRADLVSGVDQALRPSLRGYNLAFLDQSIAITSALSVMAYAFYCMEASVLLPGREFASLPFVALGVLEYLRVVHVEDEGGSPVDLVLGDTVLIFAGLGWIAATVWSLRL